MAVRVDTAGEAMLLNSVLGDPTPANGNTTFCCWVYVVTATTGATIIERLTGGGTAYYGMEMDGTGIGVRTAVDGVAGTAVNLNLTQWYHLAYRRTSNTHDLFIDGVLSQTQTATPAGDSGSNALTILGNTVSYIDARIAHGKLWEAALSDAEILSEMNSAQPKRFANLWAWYPFFPGATERLTDYGGNVRTLRAFGTLSDEDSPPVSWGGSPYIVSRLTDAIISHNYITLQAVKRSNYY